MLSREQIIRIADQAVPGSLPINEATVLPLCRAIEAAVRAECCGSPINHNIASGSQKSDGEMQWRILVRELSDDLEAEIEGRRAGEVPRRIERDLEIVKRARAMLAAAPRTDQVKE